MEDENDVYSYLYFVAREINLTDRSQTYTLVGVVNGNPKGCRDERDFPDYHTSIGNAEVCSPSMYNNYRWESVFNLRTENASFENDPDRSVPKIHYS